MEDTGTLKVKVDEVALGQVFLQVLQFFFVIIIPVMLDTHIASIYHRPYIMLAVGSIIK
jgi:hypothetical protein